MVMAYLVSLKIIARRRLAGGEKKKTPCGHKSAGRFWLAGFSVSPRWGDDGAGEAVLCGEENALRVTSPRGVLGFGRCRRDKSLPQYMEALKGY
jgi:hypothetical protein